MKNAYPVMLYWLVPWDELQDEDDDDEDDDVGTSCGLMGLLNGDEATGLATPTDLLCKLELKLPPSGDIMPPTPGSIEGGAGWACPAAPTTAATAAPPSFAGK